MCVVRETGTGPIDEKEANKILYKIHGITYAKYFIFWMEILLNSATEKKKEKKKHENLFFPSKLFHYEFCIIKCRYGVWQVKAKEMKVSERKKFYTKRNFMFDFKLCQIHYEIVHYSISCRLPRGESVNIKKKKKVCKRAK